MTSAKWIGFFVFVWIIGTIFSVTYNGGTTLAGTSSYTENASTTISNLQSGYSSSEVLPLVGKVSFISSAWGFIQSAYNAVTWRFSFLEPYPMAYWIISCFGTIGFLSLLILLYQAIRGNITWG